MNNCYLGLDIGSVSTKAVVINDNKEILSSKYILTNGNPVNAIKTILNDIKINNYTIKGVGTTGSARKLIGLLLNANIIKNEITAHATGAKYLYPDVATIIEIGGQDSKIIYLENGYIKDYAMNTLCAAGTGAFLSNQANRLEMTIEEFSLKAYNSNNPVKIAARCAVFAESDVVHKIQLGYKKEDIAAGLCKCIVKNYLNNLTHGRKLNTPIVFQGGVSKNMAVVKYFKEELGKDIYVSPNGHLVGAYGIAILSINNSDRIYNLEIDDNSFKTIGSECSRCSNNCEIIRIYKNNNLLDVWGSKCGKIIK